MELSSNDIHICMKVNGIVEYILNSFKNDEKILCSLKCDLATKNDLIMWIGIRHGDNIFENESEYGRLIDYIYNIPEEEN